MAQKVVGPRVVVAGVFLDPRRRSPGELLQTWRDFGRVPAASSRHGVDVTIVQSSWEDDTREIDGVTCHFIKEDESPFIALPGERRLRRIPRKLMARVASLTPELIHYEGLVCPRIARAFDRHLPGIPVLVQDHGTKAPRSWRRWFWRWGFSRLAGVTLTAREQARPFVRAGILRAGLPVFQVIEGSSPFTPGDQAAARARTGMDGDPCLLWVGNLDRNKDPLTVLEALELAKLPKARLHMCYRYAPLLAEVKARIERGPLEGRVVLHGEVGYPDIENCFRAADFVVQASHDEGSGYGIIEALACGTTPLVSDIPSFRRITGDGEFGALFSVEDAAALARAMKEWAEKDRGELRRRAREHFERELSFPAIGRQLADAYRQVLAGAGA